MIGWFFGSFCGLFKDVCVLLLSYFKCGFFFSFYVDFLVLFFVVKCLGSFVIVLLFKMRKISNFRILEIVECYVFVNLMLLSV